MVAYGAWSAATDGFFFLIGPVIGWLVLAYWDRLDRSPLRSGTLTHFFWKGFQKRRGLHEGMVMIFMAVMALFAVFYFVSALLMGLGLVSA